MGLSIVAPSHWGVPTVHLCPSQTDTDRRVYPFKLLSRHRPKVGLSPRLAWAIFALIGLALLAGAAQSAPTVTPDMIQTGSDTPKTFAQTQTGFDYVWQTAEIPMRDGVKLHTVIVMPLSAHDLPMLLTRSPYHVDGRARRGIKPTMLETLPLNDEVFVKDGYIRVYQDLRGSTASGGDFVLVRPPMGPLNPTNTDDTTDAYDTIDWLVHHVAESNGRVGMIGSSYEGWTVVMALLHPHPALKVAAPESPMIDGWMGDDWFHYGAFRQTNMDFIESRASRDGGLFRNEYDDYSGFLHHGSAGDWAKAAGMTELAFWRRLSAHPSYDAFWQLQALDKQIAQHPSKVPTLWLQGLFDQEDMWGAVHSWQALKAAGHLDNNYLVMGPWSHSQVNYDGASLGPLHWRGDTSEQFREEVLAPFFNRYLKDGRQSALPPRVQIYNTAENRWDGLADWPAATGLTPLYLQSGFGLDLQSPRQSGSAGDSYVSDPAKPVPYIQRPMSASDDKRWKEWLVQDQRFASDRTDVLVYETPVLTQDVRVQGAPVADIFARTTGTDTDWVVKLIDVYPGQMPDDVTMGGYELPISLDIFRGRYRKSFEAPMPIPAGLVQEYKFALPTVNHVFKPGHRIMVQIQSSLFPLYDRNPQTFVPNILFAKPKDFVPATITVEHNAQAASSVLLPIVASAPGER